jgi:hypothetical protein
MFPDATDAVSLRADRDREESPFFAPKKHNKINVLAKLTGPEQGPVTAPFRNLHRGPEATSRASAQTGPGTPCRGTKSRIETHSTKADTIDRLAFVHDMF